jgi:hypothetical protein
VLASRKRAPLALARPSARCVPIEPTFRIWIGRRSKSAGLAGDAKWRIASRRPST